MSNRSCLACGMEFVRSEPVGYVGARRTTAAALKRASREGGALLCEFSSYEKAC